MNREVHCSIGFGSLALVCIQQPTGFELYDGIKVIPAIALASVVFGSYFPDFDMKYMHMQKAAGKVVNKVTGGHRGITHTLLVPALVFVAMLMMHNFLIPYPLADWGLQSVLFGFIYGYLAHIIADMFNGKGVPILWPVSRNKISIMDLPSTGIGPWIFAGVVLVLQGFLMFGGKLL